MDCHSQVLPGLTLSSREEGGRRVVTVGGELDLCTAPQLSQALQAQLDEAARTVVVDLGEVSFLGAAGLAALARAQADAQRRGIGFRVLAEASPVRRYLALAGLNDT
ncbi:anti-sigma B factor antagonist [Amycolatopsis bartoniae]|uniref:Anti-sigma factor antagonist n=1 Tax=Amycolatopsis bartoniae TaxID=941986 RepID=A0A8H9M7A8_9PSEU|nr:anti-sigma factor antagonist [Amycolatopsis bartoniae]MBB2938056.1 anti-sigma B factor antagonist [Amycolatopsis bartoniae]GHF32384.1 hypothetical protein GCM10017566_01140 [Amycolatopsis bartoniae]